MIFIVIVLCFGVRCPPGRYTKRGTIHVQERGKFNGIRVTPHPPTLQRHSSGIAATSENGQTQQTFSASCGKIGPNACGCRPSRGVSLSLSLSFFFFLCVTKTRFAQQSNHFVWFWNHQFSAQKIFWERQNCWFHSPLFPSNVIFLKGNVQILNGGSKETTLRLVFPA